MIDKETLKKHNLKAVPFSCIGEGETFNPEDDLLGNIEELVEHKRRLVGDSIEWADGYDSPILANPESYILDDATVYVPVWRPCK